MKYQHGRELIQHADYLGDQIFEMLEKERADGVHSYRWRTLVSSIFPETEPERALGNLLALLEAKFNGICPQGTMGDWGSFWIAVYRKIGGLPDIQAYLFPPRVVVSAILFLYLCESGTNSEVAMAMKPNAVRASSRPRYLSVVGRKARSRNKAIFSDLPLSSTAKDCTNAAEALLFYRDVVHDARQTNRKEPLFVHVAHGAVQEMMEWQLREDLTTIGARSDRLSTLKILPSMIRTTVQLALQLRHPTDQGVVQMFAQHKSDTTTMGYVRKLPYRMILEERIRDFSNTIEVVMSDEITWKKMGRTKAEWRDSISNSRRTGLGVWCADPRAGAQSDFPKGTTCQAVDRCLTCSKILVIADRESIADMIIWRKSLDEAERAWLDDRTERWKKLPDYVPSSSALQTRNAIVLESSSETENRRPSGRKCGFGAA